jgi:SAM-dependent methyltransferase
MTKKFLHVGCGQQTQQDLIGFSASEWQEIRYDIDAEAKPDIQGTISNMTMVASASVDAIYSAHNIEHLYAHEVPVAMREFYRVLKADGIAVITCPDLISVCNVIAQDRLLEPLYDSPSGPIAPIDILYGHRKHLRTGNGYMAHKSGFTYKTLTSTLLQAGFQHCWGGSRPSHYDLWVVAFKSKKTEQEIIESALKFLPQP